MSSSEKIEIGAPKNLQQKKILPVPLSVDNGSLQQRSYFNIPGAFRTVTYTAIYPIIAIDSVSLPRSTEIKFVIGVKVKFSGIEPFALQRKPVPNHISEPRRK